MNRYETIAMLEELVMEIDYDIFKSIFVRSCVEDLEEAEKNQDTLVDIVNKHLEKAKRAENG